MNPAVAILPVTIALTGIAILLTELLAPAPPARRWARPGRISTTTLRKTAPRIAAGIGLGIAAYLVSGWPVALVAAPAVLLLLPRVLTGPDTRGLKLTEALAGWTRNLAGLVRTGSLGLEDVLRFSLPATPDLLRPQVAALVARLRGGWDTEAALRALADDLADPTADKVAAHLVQAARKRAGDLPHALAALGVEMAGELRMRRDVEADRAKPRQSLRTVTLITLTVIAGLAVFGRTAQFSSYATPVGQLLLTFWIGLYAVLLLWAQTVLRERPAARILTPARTGRRETR